MKQVAIIGGGNAGHAFAVDNKLGGAEVRLFEFEKYEKNVERLRDTKQIEFYGPEINLDGFSRQGVATIDMVTCDIEEAISGVKHILVGVRASSFEETFRELIPHLEDGQIVSILPDNYGSLVFRKLMREMNCNKNIIVAGWQTIPFGTRVTGTENGITKVYTLYRKNKMRFDTLPSCDADAYLGSLAGVPLFDCITPIHGDTVLDIAFSNSNPILHVPATLLNAGAIDNWGIIPYVGDKDIYFDIYKHGFSESVSKVQWEVYQEEIEIAKKLGVGIESYAKKLVFSRAGFINKTIFKDESEYIPLDKPIPDDKWMLYLKGERFTMETRYLTEDVAVGCNVFYQLAQKAGVEVPVIESLIRLASVINGVDYFKEGTSLKDLGIDHLTLDQLLEYLRKGSYKLK